MKRSKQHFFDLEELAKEFPETADDMLKDIRMSDERSASCRLVRMYKKLPLHIHRVSDENVFVVAGRALFQLGDEKREIRTGMFIRFPREMPHAILEILEAPLLTLTVDTPRRPEKDVIFLSLMPDEVDRTE